MTDRGPPCAIDAGREAEALLACLGRGGALPIALRGSRLPRHPLFSKDAAFSSEERAVLGLGGLLPDRVATIESRLRWSSSVWSASACAASTTTCRARPAWSWPASWPPRVVAIAVEREARESGLGRELEDDGIAAAVDEAMRCLACAPYVPAT